MTGILRIKDIAFDVDQQKSEFLAYIPQESPGKQSSGRLNWSLEINCVDREYERGFWPPYLYANQMTFDVSDWKMIDGQTVRSDDPDELAAYLYVQEHEMTSGNSISFRSRRDNLFTVEWECLADVFWDDEYSSGLPVRLNTEILFSGVHVSWMKANAQGLAEATELIGRHFDLGCLGEPQIIGPSHIVFPPRPTAIA